MAQIAYLLLCHKNAPRVLEQVRVLTALDDKVVIHADANAGPAFRKAIASGIKDNASAVLAKSEKCGWGEWSLVAATLNMVRTGLAAFPDATHFYLISGDCMPCKPAGYIHARLDTSDQDMIEHADFFADNWIKTGLHEDRLIYRHWFNERRQQKLFYGSLALQRRFGLKRAVPQGIRMRIGSQWWVLRRATLESILAFLSERPDVQRFFRTTWIPDETFFQTLTMHLVPREQVVSAPPTYLMFSDYGMPVTFCADHFQLLRTQGSFFARKISDHDGKLREDLARLFVSDDPIGETVDSGRALYDYIRQRGRKGRRFGTRAWEAAGRLGPERRINVIICKKWHLAKSLAAAVRAVGGRAAYGYVFDEEAADLPEMGNLDKGLAKRVRHRRAFLSMLLAQAGANTLTFCLDPSNISTLEDLATDGCRLHVLEIDCDLDDAWLSGHATRVGLGSKADAGALHAGLMTTLRQNIADERAAIRDLHLPGHKVIRTGDNAGAMARPIAEAFDLSIDAGGRVAQQADLNDD